LPAVGARPPPLAREVRHGTWTYVVERGDTLLEIARWYGVSLDELVHLNRLRDPDRIEVGQRLVIPVNAARRHAPAVLRPVESRLLRQRQELARAQRQLASADFGGAAQRLEDLRRQLDPAEPGSREIMIGVEETSAHVHAAFGDQQQAAAAFERALRLDPAYEPPSSCPPKVLSAFQTAQRDGAAP
jgi:LysM repeat protein